MKKEKNYHWQLQYKGRHMTAWAYSANCEYYTTRLEAREVAKRLANLNQFSYRAVKVFHDAD